MKYNSLISIVVITFNSSKYILETLESIKNQTFKNLELVISDDASKDDTVFLSEKWLSKNKERFVSSRIVVATQNGGIAKNCNQGVKASKGNWYKIIAGDDLLKEDAIEQYCKFAALNPEANFILAKPKMFKNDFSMDALYESEIYNAENIFNSNLSAQVQFQKVIRNKIIAGNTFFIKRSLYDRLSGYDEEFKMVEDFPFLLKCLQNNERVLLMNKFTVYYRIHDEAVSKQSKNFIFNGFYKHLHPIMLKYALPSYTKREKKQYMHEYCTKFFFDKYKLNSNNWFCKKLFNLLFVRLSEC